jgi:hypothetical protein
MTAPEAARLWAGVADRVRYKRGWSILVSDGALQVAYDGLGDYGPTPWTGRRWLLSPKMTETELVYTAFKAILAAEEHEARECFLYEGVAVCGPHYSVRDIIDLCRTRRLGVDVRADAMEGA